jgi:hypothetical protein
MPGALGKDMRLQKAAIGGEKQSQIAQNIKRFMAR